MRIPDSRAFRESSHLRRLPMMFRFLASTLLALSICTVSLSGAETKKKKRPPPIVSPQILEEGKVTFQIKAPEANQVSVSGEMTEGRVPMNRDSDGIWRVTLEGLTPGIYGYSFVVDGNSRIDPGNSQIKPMRSPKTSILHLTGDNAYDFKDVPHGTVHSHAYHSKPIDRFREMRVYTPPGYENSDASYPLLVLQHGHSDSFATWTTYGKAHWILDNLIAEGKAKPMIVVMLDGHPIPESYGNGRSPENTEELRKDLLEVVLPRVAEQYRVLPGRENRAIAGLSMGGLHALTVGFSELDTFSTIASFSGAIPEGSFWEEVLGDTEKVNSSLDLLWIACGKQDFLLEGNKEFIAMLEKRKIEHEWLLTEGGHSWPIWRDYLTQLVPRLFQK